MLDSPIDIEKLKKLQFKVMQDVAAAAVVPLMRIGDQLGLFKQLSELGEVSSQKFAEEAQVDERYLREWLYAVSAAGFISYNKENKTFSLSPEQRAVFAHEEGPANMIGAYDVLTGAVHNEKDVLEAFKTGAGVPYEDACPICFQGTARFFKPSYQANLIKKWLPLIEGFEEKMKSGGSFADIGCGHGLSTLMIADAFPSGKVAGFDIHGPSIDQAKKESESLIVEMNEKFHKSSEIRKNLAKNKIVQMKEAAINEIKEVSIKIALESVTKIITTSVDKSKLDNLFYKNLEETKAALKKVNS